MLKIHLQQIIFILINDQCIPASQQSDIGWKPVIRPFRNLLMDLTVPARNCLQASDNVMYRHEKYLP